MLTNAEQNWQTKRKTADCGKDTIQPGWERFCNDLRWSLLAKSKTPEGLINKIVIRCWGTSYARFGKPCKIASSNWKKLNAKFLKEVLIAEKCSKSL